MKTLIIIILLFTTLITAQTTYEVTPGTKGNQIILSLSNLSKIINAENVQVKLSRISQNLTFNKEVELIERIDPKEETETVFLFNSKREIPINLKDTIEFLITDNKSIFTTKQIILSYTPPKDYKLEQNFPNPFNPSTTIQYQLPMDEKVILKVYDILGSEVVSLVDEFQQAGYKEIHFDASKLASGVYVYRLVAGKFIFTKKMIVMK